MSAGEIHGAVPLLQDYLQHSAAVLPDKIALVSRHDRFSYRELAERSNALVHVVTLQPPRVLIGGVQAPLTFGGHMLPAVGARTIEFEGGWALRNIAESTGGRFWEAESLERLKTAFATIAEAMGKRYVLRYSPDGVPRPGWHKLALKLRKKKGDVHTRTGYWVKEP